MKEEQLPKVYYRGNEFVMVQKAPEGFGPGSVVYGNMEYWGQALLFGLVIL